MLRRACRSLPWLALAMCLLTVVDAGRGASAPPASDGDRLGRQNSPAILLAQAKPEAPPKTQPADGSEAPEVQHTGIDKDQLKEFTSTIDVWTVQVTALDQVVKDAEATDEQLRELPGILEGLRTEISKFVGELKPRLEEARARLETLGPGAKEGEPEEPPEIAAQRKVQGAEVAVYDGLIKQADVLLVRVAQLIDSSNVARRERFTESLLTPIPNLYSPYLWRRAFANLPLQFELANRELSGWLESARSNGIGLVALLFVAPFAAAALIWFLARDLNFRRSISGGRPLKELTQAQRGAAATLEAAKAAAPYLGALGAFYLTVFTAGLVTATGDGFLSNASVAAGAGVFLIFLFWETLTPSSPSWRLVPADNTAAWRLALLLTTLILVWLMDQVLNLADPFLYTSYPSIVLRSVVVAGIIALLLAAMVLIPIGKHRSRRGMIYRGWPAWLFLAILLTAGFVALAGILGYIALARFVATQAVMTGGVVASMYLLHLAVEHLSTSRAAPQADEVLLEGADEVGGPSPLGTLRVLLALVLDVLILIVGVTILLLQWRFDWVEVQSWVAKAFVGIPIGGLTISLQAVLIALAVFASGLLLTRVVQRWLIKRTPIGREGDIGVRESIRTGVGYLGFTLSAIAAISYLGIGFTNLAIVAGALSVGIGFGLQSIFNNFVSGLILLVERPIKVGDWIVVGSYEGTVKRISVRATEIETVHRESVIIPNANLITDTVTNWMHTDKMGRIDIPIGVSYSTDVEVLREALLKVADGHPAVLKKPAPVVHFEGYGDSSLDFQLRVFLRDIGRRIAITSELRFGMWFALKEADITIPFPQRDLHIKDFDMIHAAGAKYVRIRDRDKEGEAPEPEPRRKPRRS